MRSWRPWVHVVNAGITHASSEPRAREQLLDSRGSCAPTAAMSIARLSTGLVLLMACGESTSALPDTGLPDVEVVDSADGTPSDGDTSSDTSVGPEVRLVEARLRAGGVWLGSERVESTALGSTWKVGVTAGSALSVEVIEVELAVSMPLASAWLSNGFQSWSQSGVLALADAPPDAGELDAALTARGDAEVIRDGRGLAWWYTWVAGPADGPAVVAGALEGDRLAASVTTWREGDLVHLVLRSGGNGDALVIGSGEDRHIETWHVATADGPGALEGLLVSFGDALPSRRATHEVPAEAGWNSWYDLWSSVDEDAVRANAARLDEGLGPRLPTGSPPLRIVVDDGWQLAWGDWYPNTKFPSGLDGLARDLRSDGFAMGVWLAPLLVHEDSSVAREHPDWLVPDATFDHLVEGRMRILDPFQPGAADHLRATAARLVGWGYDLLKIDFLFAGTFPGTRANNHTGMEAYRRALELLREGAGEDTLLLAVGNPATPALPYVDVWRVGGDIAVEPLGPSFPFIVNELRSIAARWPFCRATLCDADPPLLRALPSGEVDFGAWVVALTGGGVFLSDDLRALPGERFATLTPAVVGMGIGERSSVPVDLVPTYPPTDLRSALIDVLRGELEQVAPTRWRLPNGRHIVFDAARHEVERERWPAVPGTSWQIQLEGELDRAIAAKAFDVDLFDTSLADLAALQRDGAIVICYFSAGSWEDWRPDRDAFPVDARGQTLNGFDDERWLDIRRTDVRTALEARLDLAVERGCDAVDPDNVEGFLTDTGWSLTSADQLAFNRWLAAEAHTRGLAIGLKNDLDQVDALVDDFDFAVNESCLVHGECDQLRPFIAAGKAVFHIEYADEGQTLTTICDEPTSLGFSTVLKRSTQDVDAWRETCP